MPPTLAHLSRVYFELARYGARAIGRRSEWVYHYDSLEELLTLACDMSRYDPRLFSILTEYLFFHWKKINPLKLREHIKLQQSKLSILVMMAFVVNGLKDAECQFFYEYLAKGYAPVSPQLYFYGLYLPGSYSMERASHEPLQEFLTWGFLARERPIIHHSDRVILGHWGTQARQNIIRRLLKKRNAITLYDYLNSTEHTISRQQALADLKGSSYVEMKGKGRGTIWIKKQ